MISETDSVSPGQQQERSRMDKKIAARRAELATFETETTTKLVASQKRIAELGSKTSKLVQITREMQRMMKEGAQEDGLGQGGDTCSPLSATQSQ